MCRDLRRRSRALPRPEPTATAELVRVGRRARSRCSATRSVGIQSLDAPSADERTVGRWLDFVDAALDAGAASLAAQSSGDLAAARAANARGTRPRRTPTSSPALLRVDDCATPVTG